MKEILNNMQVYEVADKLYKHVNPNSSMDTPNVVYETTMKWYGEYNNVVGTKPDFFEWCIKNKQK